MSEPRRWTAVVSPWSPEQFLLGIEQSDDRGHLPTAKEAKRAMEILNAHWTKEDDEMTKEQEEKGAENG